MKPNLSGAAQTAAIVIVLSGLTANAAWAQQQIIVQDDFTGTTTSNTWKWFNGACLTAGDGTNGVPSCQSLAKTYYNETLVGGASGTLPDLVGSGALRFTNGSPGGYHQNGAIVSQLSPAFSTKDGIQVTFTTVTYEGNSGGGGKDGADGISFFLMDAAQPAGIGAWGGSLGYSCSNTNPPYNGLVGAYVGLGIDEFGNFLNGGPTRSTTFPNNGPDNTASGWGYQPGRIGLRGAGNIAWSWLNTNYPNQYPSYLTTSQQQSAVQNTCSTGYLWDYSHSSAVQTQTPVMDYPAIPGAYDVLNGVSIANEAATKRGDATPISYKLRITAGGLLSFAYSVNGGAYTSVITNQAITASNGSLPSAGLQFGFAGSTGGSTNIHEILCFKATPANQAASSGGINQKQTGQVISSTQVYFAAYNADTWSGSLTAHNLVINPDNTVSIGVANWDASCVLTGVPAGQTCPTTGTGPSSAEAPTQRAILTWSGTKGIPFEWNSLTPAEQNTLDLNDPTNTANRLNYLRGDRSNEVTSTGGGLYRDRASVLGDIIDSGAAWVGPPSTPYPGTWQDMLNMGTTMPENSGPSYPTFAASAQTRLNVVYSGANDGLLHGFRAGSYDASNNYVVSTNDGYEALAYMPGAVLQSIHNPSDPKLDFSDPHYGHNYYVDAPPGTGDLFYAGAWHTWLVGGLGPGGAGIYALDVTNPANFSEGAAASLVIGDWTSATLACVNVSNCGSNLGNTYGMPQIRRLHNGTWGVIFGNGFGSTSGDAGIYVMTVNPTSGSTAFYYLSTGKAGSNGIAFTQPLDMDGDHITDYVYAGDLLGNIWRFDLTSSNPSNWAAASAPLFTTPAGQPITTKVTLVLLPSTQGRTQLLVEFGTGQVVPLTNTSPLKYAAGQQSLYGIWDWDMSAWNAKSSVKYASLTAPQTIPVSALQTQTTTDLGNGFRSVTNNPVCWQGSTGCTGATAQYGWVLQLPGTSTNTTTIPTTTNTEQIVFNPTVIGGVMFVNTTIAASTTPLSCTVGTPTGWTMALNPANGGSTKFFVLGDGAATNGTGTDSIAMNGTDAWLVTQTVDGNGTTRKGKLPQGTKGGRLTWIERR
jgi:type IV pilus assembly protein PilY1